MLVPVLLGVFLIPTGNVIVAAGVHLMPVRIISFFGWLRLLYSKLRSHSSMLPEAVYLRRHGLYLVAISRSSAVVLLWMSRPAFINEVGHLWSLFGMYFLLRYLIRDSYDIRWSLSSLY